MSSPLWFVKLVRKSFPQRFIMARLTRLPLIGRGIDHLLFDRDDIVYLPKDRAIAVNEEVEAEGVVLPSRVIGRGWCSPRGSSRPSSKRPTTSGS